VGKSPVAPPAHNMTAPAVIWRGVPAASQNAAPVTRPSLMSNL